MDAANNTCNGNKSLESSVKKVEEIEDDGGRRGRGKRMKEE